jgi:hypothetical protein
MGKVYFPQRARKVYYKAAAPYNYIAKRPLESVWSWNLRLEERVVKGRTWAPASEQFWVHVEKNALTLCLLPKVPSMTIDGVAHTLQQAAWRIFVKNVVPRKIVAHCDTPNCANPDHLYGSDFTCAKGHPRDPRNMLQPKGARYICAMCHLAKMETCPSGHYYDERGSVNRASGWRYCKECSRLKMIEKYEDPEFRLLHNARNRAAYRKKRETSQKLSEKVLKST